MFRALHELLNGRKDVVNPPFLVQQKAAPVQRSSDLLSCYSILADVSAACVSPHAVQDEDQVGWVRWSRCLCLSVNTGGQQGPESGFYAAS